jgi:hypothetical protein
MTLVVGWKCKDGFVVGADTEIEYGSVNFQKKKLYDYYGTDGTKPYDLVIGGAGHASYIAMAAQNIRDAVASLDVPTITNIKDVIGDVIESLHSNNLKYWGIDEPMRPRVDLIIGIKDKQSDVEVLAVRQTAVNEIDQYESIGSGSELAEHLAEKLSALGLTTAVAVHVVRQIFREVKGKGPGVGGNTQVIAVRAPTIARKAEEFYDLQWNKRDYRYLWGLDDCLLSAVRVALDSTKSDKALDTRLRTIARRLRNIRSDAEKPRSPSGTKLDLLEFGSEYQNPMKDI